MSRIQTGCLLQITPEQDDREGEQHLRMAKLVSNISKEGSDMLTKL